MTIDLSNPEHVEYLRSGGWADGSGTAVTTESAMRVAMAWRCTHILAGLCGNNPIDVLVRKDERTRVPAVGHSLRRVLTERPNGWQSPAEFRKMLTAHAVNKGGGYGLIIWSLGRILEIWPLLPDSMECKQRDDRSLAYTYTTPSGRKVPLEQKDVLHLRGLSWDGVNGMGVLRAARESLGGAMVQDRAAHRMFRNGHLSGSALTTDRALSDQAYDRLRNQVEEEKSGAENAGKLMILEEGLDFSQAMFSATDLQFLDARRFSRTDIAIFYGVPEFLAGSGEKDSNWGTGLDQKGTSFLQYGGMDWIVMWEQGLERCCLTDADRAKGIVVKIDVRGMQRGDQKTRTDTYAKALGAGGADTAYMTKNEVRALEDLPPLAPEIGDVLPKPQPVKPAAPEPEESDAPKPRR